MYTATKEFSVRDYSAGDSIIYAAQFPPTLFCPRRQPPHPGEIQNNRKGLEGALESGNWHILKTGRCVKKVYYYFIDSSFTILIGRDQSAVGCSNQDKKALGRSEGG